MATPGSIDQQILDLFYVYWTGKGDQVIDIKWHGHIIVVTLPDDENQTGNIEIYKGREDLTPNYFPEKQMDKPIPATPHNLFGVMTLLYKQDKEK